MDLLLLGLFSAISLSHCFNYGRFSHLLNFATVNPNEILVRDSDNQTYQEHEYTPKSGFQICKITDGINIVWEDKQKLTQCVKATTVTKNNLIHLIHLVIKRTAKISEDKYYKRLDTKFMNIAEQEFDLLKSDPDLLTDNTIYFDVNSKIVDDRLFKSAIKHDDGVPTLLVEANSTYKLIAVYDDFRLIWSSKGSAAHVENLIAYFFYTRYYLLMLKLKDNEDNKIINFMFRDGEWLEVEYYTFMNKFLRLKSHIPVTGYLSFDITDLPGEDHYSIEKDEKYGIELMTYCPRRGFILNSLLKGENIIWESATERCSTVMLLKKSGTIYGINLTLLDDHDKRTAINFAYKDHSYRQVSDEDFKIFNASLVDPEDYRKYHQEHPPKQKEPEKPEVIIEEPDSTEPEETQPETSADETETLYHPSESEQPPQSEGTKHEQQGPEEQTDEDQASEQPHEHSLGATGDAQLLDLSDYNSRVFLRNNFKMNEVDTYEYLCKPGTLVSSIVDGGIPVWEAPKSQTFSKLYVSHREGLSQLMKLVTQAKTGEAYLFFKRHNASFETIKSGEYTALLQKMENSVNLLDNSILLSLSTTPQDKYFDYHNEFDDGVSVSKIVTKSMYKLTKIIYADNLLWTSSNNEKCSSLTRNKFYKNDEMLLVSISGPSTMSVKYFKKSEGFFSEVDKATYEGDYKTLKDLIPVISNVGLDINSDPNESHFLYSESPEGRFTHGRYFPRSGYVLNKVSSRSNVLWTSTRNRCKQVSVFTASSSRKLVRLSFVNTTTPELYFNFVNGKFVKLRNFIEFDFTLKELNKPDSEEDSCAFCRSQLDRRFEVSQDAHAIYLNTQVDTNTTHTCFNPDLVLNKIFAPKDGYVFNNVTDGDTILFNSKSDFNLCVYAHLFYDSAGARLAKLRTVERLSPGPGSIYYLEISDHVSTNLTPEQFEAKIVELTAEMTKLAETQKKKITLDLTNGSDEYLLNSSKFRGLPYKDFKAKNGHFFTKVIFAPDLHYSLDADEDCLLVRPYFFLNFPVLVQMDFALTGDATSKLYLYRFGNEFTSMEFPNFDNLLKSISDLVSKCVALDLSGFDAQNTFEVSHTEPNSSSTFNLKTFSSGNKYFTSITAKGLNVWSANHDLFLATEVAVHYLEADPILIKASLRNLDHDETNLFFEFKSGNWNPVNYNEYNKRLILGSTASSEEPETLDGDQFDVDITNNINPEYVRYASGSANGVQFIEVSLKEHSNSIKSISDNGKLIWEPTNPNFACKKAVVYYFERVPQLLRLVLISQSDGESHAHKHVSNGYWLDIDEDIFARKLASFESKSNVPKDQEPPRRLLSKLNTAKVDDTLVRFTTVNLLNIYYKQYKPIQRSAFIEVVDGTLIWRSQGDFECNLARIYVNKQKSVLSKLFLSNDLGVDQYLYFVNTDDAWNVITSKEFESRLDEMEIVTLYDDSSYEVPSDPEPEPVIEAQDYRPPETEHTAPEGDKEPEAQAPHDAPSNHTDETPSEDTNESTEQVKADEASADDSHLLISEQEPTTYDPDDPSSEPCEEIIIDADPDTPLSQEPPKEEDEPAKEDEELVKEDEEQPNADEKPIIVNEPPKANQPPRVKEKPTNDNNKSPNPIPMILDIQKLDYDELDVKNSRVNPFLLTTITIKEEANVIHITEGTRSLWTTNGSQRCVEAKIYRIQTWPLLAELVLKCKQSKVVFLVKEQKDWKVVDEDKFVAFYDSLDK